MIYHMFYCEFITSFHPHYNGAVLKPYSWCHDPVEVEDHYIEFIKRILPDIINITFFAKYDFVNKQILIKCEYEYFVHYYEKSEVNFVLKGYKDNTYNYTNIHGIMINHLADEEILTFINMFDQFFLEQKDDSLTQTEFEIYVKHLRIHPELIKDYHSSTCDFRVELYYNRSEYNITVKFHFHDKINKYKHLIDFHIYKNRLVGNMFNDLDVHVNDAISTRMDLINIDYMEFVAFRL